MGISWAKCEHAQLLWRCSWQGNVFVLSQQAEKTAFMAETLSDGNATFAAPAWPGQAGGCRHTSSRLVSGMVHAMWPCRCPKASLASQLAWAPSKLPASSCSSRLTPILSISLDAEAGFLYDGATESHMFVCLHKFFTLLSCLQHGEYIEENKCCPCVPLFCFSWLWDCVLVLDAHSLLWSPAVFAAGWWVGYGDENEPPACPWAPYHTLPVPPPSTRWDQPGLTQSALGQCCGIQQQNGNG